MNFRDKLTGKEEADKSYIKFELSDDWVHTSYECEEFELAQFCLNIIDIAERILTDENIPDGIVDAIHQKWEEQVKILSKKH